VLVRRKAVRVGTPVTLNNIACTIVGVLPRDFSFREQGPRLPIAKPFRCMDTSGASHFSADSQATSKMVLPSGTTEDDDVVCAGMIFPGKEVAAAGHARSQQRKEILPCGCAREAPCLVRAVEPSATSAARTMKSGYGSIAAIFSKV